MNLIPKWLRNLGIKSQPMPEPTVTFVKPNRRVNRVFIHCTASDAKGPAFEGKALVETITSWHVARKFSTIGYHFIIDKNGLLMKGRDLEITPAAQEGNNAGTIAICLHGLSKDNFTLAQFSTLLRLTKEINKAYNEKITFHGHREVSSKTCPVFDYKTVLKLDKTGRMVI